MTEDKRNPNNCNENNDIQKFFVLLDDLPHILIAQLRNCVETGHVNLFINVNQKLKSTFVFRDNVVNTSSKGIFDFVVPRSTAYIDCNSPNVIYLITCNRYTLEYVGETVQKLNKLFNWHRMLKCFLFNPKYLKQQEGNSSSARNGLDAFIISRSRQYEKIQMLK